MSANVIVCSTGVREIHRRVLDCPTCKRRRRHVVVYPDNPYYGADVACLGCGDRWSDGELYPRPFQRGWREKAKANAREQWDNAFTQTEEERAAWWAFWTEPGVA